MTLPKEGERRTWRFTSIYSDGDRIVEGQRTTDDPEAVVRSILAFRDDQDQAPIRVEYEADA